MADTDSSDEPARNTNDQITGEGESSDAKKILIVDDDMEIVDTVTYALEGAGYKVIAVSYTHLTLPTKA